MSAPTPHLLPRSPGPCLDGHAAILDALVNDFGFTVETADLDDSIGVLDLDRHTISIDRHSPFVDQVHFLLHCWQFCAVAPVSAPDMEPMPLLTLVQGS